jgi:indole-3-glycerol phosphate synthase
MSLLARIVAHKRWEVATEKRLLSEKELRDRVGLVPRARDFVAAMRRGQGPRVIAEFKRASPTRGVLRAAADPAKVCCEFVENGAVAVSVVTDNRWFWGSVCDLWLARESISIPILCWDFVVDPYQIYQARAHGADAVRLVCTLLDDRKLIDCASLARALDMTAIIEAHDEREVERALAADALVIGLSNRDLQTMEVVPGTAERLRPLVPADRITVAESGIRSAEELGQLSPLLFDACLVGEALMSADSPGAALRALLGR